MDELTRERYPPGVPRERPRHPRPPVRTHLYAEDPKSGPDHRGHYRCMCGLPKLNEAHTLPSRSDEERAAEARRMGES
jgi:hypothetical protein